MTLLIVRRKKIPKTLFSTFYCLLEKNALIMFHCHRKETLNDALFVKRQQLENVLYCVKKKFKCGDPSPTLGIPELKLRSPVLDRGTNRPYGFFLLCFHQQFMSIIFFNFHFLFLNVNIRFSNHPNQSINVYNSYGIIYNIP